MPDIAMCDRQDCPLASKCYRFRAKPTAWQSYFQPVEIGEKCEYFVEYLKANWDKVEARKFKAMRKPF
jgi:hypothetical protein